MHSPSRSALHRAFAWLLWPLLTSRSAVRTASPFRAQGEISPGKVSDLLRATAGFTLTACGRESFAVACPLALPCTPAIRFLFVSPRVRYPLLSALPSRSAPCGSLGSLRPTPQGTSTPKSQSMLGTHERGAPSRGAPVRRSSSARAPYGRGGGSPQCGHHIRHRVAMSSGWRAARTGRFMELTKRRWRKALLHRLRPDSAARISNRE